MRKSLGVVAALLVTGLVVGGCSEGDQSSGEDPVVVKIEFKDGTVSPVGEVVDVKPDQPIDLEVTADEAGQIHVHSDPEQEFAYPAGTKTFKFEVPRPGLVEVESHELDQVIVKLQVQ